MPPHVSSTCAHHQEVKIALHSLWYHHTYRWPSRARDGHLQTGTPFRHHAYSTSPVKFHLPLHTKTQHLCTDTSTQILVTVPKMSKIARGSQQSACIRYALLPFDA